MSKDATIYEKLTTPLGMGLSTGTVTAGSLLALRAGLGSRLARKGLAKAIAATEGIRGVKQQSLPFKHMSSAKEILGRQTKPGGILSKGNIALATLLGGGSAAAMSDFSRKNYAENLAVRIKSGKDLSRAEKQAIREIADLRKIPKTSDRPLTTQEKAVTSYWSPAVAGTTAGVLGAALNPGSLAVRGAMGAFGAGSAVGDTKYRQFIMAKALRDRFRNSRKLNKGEKNLLKTVKSLGAQNA